MARPTLEEACGLLLQNESDSVFQSATETLFKVFQNVLQHPDDAKYRTLRRTTSSFATNLGSAKGAVRLLKAAGFVEQGEATDAALVLPADVDVDLLSKAKAALKSMVKHRMQQRSRELEVERARENAEAVQKLADLRAVSERNTAKQTAEAAAERERLRRGLQIDRDDWHRQRDPNNMK